MSNDLHTNNNSAGKIISFFSGVAKIDGLKNVSIHDILTDKNKDVAIVVGFDGESVEALFFDNNFDLDSAVFNSGRPFSVQVSNTTIGRVLNGFGIPVDEFGEDKNPTEINVFSKAPQIIDREPVTRPLTTGIKIIDTNLPTGRGQRELIIGDRKLGKSTIAIDIILNQKNADTPVNCVYALIGQNQQQIEESINIFTRNNAFLYSTIVGAPSDATYAEQYLAPFVACAIGEYFRDKGEDSLVIYDDLSKHAKVHRDASLLLERSPGREAYPGDIFALHAILLERAAQLSAKHGGGSLTAFPIIETQEGDITSYISTNIISITDGQIYLESGLYQKGFLPAVNVGLSVSRIGSKAQASILTEVVGDIRLVLAQHKELQKLSQLETVVSEKAKEKIHRGSLMLELLKQDKHINVTWPEQVILFYVVEEGFFDDIVKDSWTEFEILLLAMLRARYRKTLNKIKSGTFDTKIKSTLKEIVKDFKEEFLITSTPK